MAKVLKCKDVGMDCDIVARADTEEEVLKSAGEHAGPAHGMMEMRNDLGWDKPADDLMPNIFTKQCPLNLQFAASQ